MFTYIYIHTYIPCPKSIHHKVPCVPHIFSTISPGLFVKLWQRVKHSDSLRVRASEAFRVFHRIANVMAGVGDTPDMASALAAEQIPWVFACLCQGLTWLGDAGSTNLSLWNRLHLPVNALSTCKFDA